jgi:predicted glycoside hydrolase/deacetylase ChbG (UPF0249 family)
MFPDIGTSTIDESIHVSDGRSRSGLLIVNADDWGRDPFTTGRILGCVLRGTVSSVSAMVFMEDSERAAAVAQERGIDAGLHLNFTTPFSDPHCSDRLVEYQHELARYLLRHPLARAVFHPGLVRSFEYVVSAQIDEFCKLYQKGPARVDGHHHMHLCANVLLGGLLPKGSIVRRHFSYETGEKVVRNQIFREFTKVMLSRRHRLVDYFFSLPPLEPLNRLQRIFSLARCSAVELETHPVNLLEHQFLVEGGIARLVGDLQISPRFSLS